MLLQMTPTQPSGIHADTSNCSYAFIIGIVIVIVVVVRLAPCAVRRAPCALRLCLRDRIIALQMNNSSCNYF